MCQLYGKYQLVITNYIIFLDNASTCLSPLFLLVKILIGLLSQTKLFIEDLVFEKFRFSFPAVTRLYQGLPPLVFNSKPNPPALCDSIFHSPFPASPALVSDLFLSSSGPGSATCSLTTPRERRSASCRSPARRMDSPSPCCQVQPRQLRRYKYLYNIGIHFVTGHHIFQCFGSIFIVPDLAKNLNLDLAKI